MPNRIKKGDMVVVVAGDDRGKTGKVLHVFHHGKKKGRVIVEGVNFVKRAERRSQKNPQGGLVEREAPIHLSNVMLRCPKTGEPTRVGTMKLADGRRARLSKASGEMAE